MLFVPAPSSVLALLTTIHLGLAALRRHRSPSKGPVGVLAAVSLLMAAFPWLLPTAAGLALGIAVHLAWFGLCEYLAPPASARTPVSRVRPSETRPASASAAGPAGSPRPTAPAPIKGFVQVPVLSTFDETPHIKTIRVARPEGFQFAPGQFMPVRIKVEGKELTRCYSISSSPSSPGYLEISVKRQGVVSNALHATVRPGALLSIRQPAGSFRYPGDDDRPVVLIAGGIGITPLMSMLRHAVATHPTRPITLLYGAHTEGDFAFRDELECLARRHPQFHLHLAAATGPTAPHVYPGRIDSALIDAAAPDIAHSLVLLCGPAPMIDALRTALLEVGVPPAQIRHEVFEAAVAASADAPPRQPVAPSRARGYRMSCTRSERDVDIRAGQTLLEAAEGAGVGIPSLCRAGVCGTCRVQVTDGQVDCESQTLSSDEADEGFVLACVTTAQSDCAVSV